MKVQAARWMMGISTVCVALSGAAPVAARVAASPVADAAMGSDVAAVRTLLQGGADVNGAQGDGMTALHWAAERGNADVASIVIKAGASVGAETRIGRYTPLHVAAKGGHAEVVRQLIDAKADVSALSTTGAVPLQLAAASGSRAAVEMLLDAGASIDAREPQWGQTPLMFAAALGRTDVVKLLLARGADVRATGKVVDLRIRDEHDSAETKARAARMAAIQKQLVAARSTMPSPAAATAARPARGAERNPDEEEPLGYAELIGAQGGLTALLLATREGLADTVLALVEGGADINQVSAADHTSPLLMATINGHFDLAKEMLARGADVTTASDAGGTPLYGVLNVQWAPKSRHPQSTGYMQQQTGYLELAETFLKAGADVNARLGKTLWYTTYNRDLLGVDRTGATPFWLAAYSLDVPAMKLLLAYGADPNIGTTKVPEEKYEGLEGLEVEGHGKDPSGLPALPRGGPAVAPILAASGVGYGLGYAGNNHRHAPDGWVPAVKFLVEVVGADVNARDHLGYTPLHHAASRGDNELIRYLVSKGADVKAVARTGQTTIDLANGPVQRTQPFPETIALLESLGAKNSHRCLSC